MDGKYPRTPHLEISPGRTGDDLVLPSSRHFAGAEVVVTEKLDGENTTMTRDSIHARSLTTPSHPSRDWVRALWGRLRFEIPLGWRIIGENVYARHTVSYDALPSFFLVFAVVDADRFYSWEFTEYVASELGLPTVPVLYRGVWGEDAVKACFTGVSQCGGDQEGYVVRTAEGFDESEFGLHVAKFVDARFAARIGDAHWLERPVVPNKLRKE